LAFSFFLQLRFLLLLQLLMDKTLTSALIKQGFEPASEIDPVKRPCGESSQLSIDDQRNGHTYGLHA